MELLTTIDRNNKLPKAEDYHFLRKEAIRLVEELSGNVWSDYNTHDPGITLLEAVCFTLTDLAYRTSFDIKDHLASVTEKQGLYAAQDILSVNPVTLTDYRKLIIDTAGVKNAWIETSSDAELPLYIVQKEGQSGYELSYTNPGGEPRLPVKGLYKVFVEFQEDIIFQKSEADVIAAIRHKLQEHRNLCEDFISIAPIGYEDFSISAVLQVSEGSDIEKITASVYDLVSNYFSPPITFYTYEQMMEKGYSTEEIFEGPLLRHGFIDSHELALSDRYKDIHLSDIMNLISGLEGVIAIRKLSIPADSRSSFSDFSEWTNEMKYHGKAPRLDAVNSSISFVRSGDRHRSGEGTMADNKRAVSIFKFLKSSRLRNRLRGTLTELKIPLGEDRMIEAYYPFQHSLPSTYGMEETFLGLPEHGASVTETQEKIKKLDLRKKQILQLRGFLMAYEQILADYLSNLSQVGKLLSFDTQVQQRYFPQQLAGIRDFEWLLVDPAEYQNKRSQLTENPEQFGIRKNRILDHLLARFGESFDKYNFFMKKYLGDSANARLVEDKTSFLNEYIRISNYRGRGYKYLRDPNEDTEAWGTDNVEGFKKRVCGLLGIKNHNRDYTRTDLLRVERTSPDNDLVRYVVVLDNPDQPDQALLRTIEYDLESDAKSILVYILENGANKSLYLTSHQKDRWTYHFTKPHPDNEPIIATSHFHDREAFESAYQKTIETLSKITDNENFHVLEHILLRPKITPREKSGKKPASWVDADRTELLSPGDVAGLVKLEKTEEPPFRFKIINIQPAGSSTPLWHLSLVGDEANEPLTVEENFDYYPYLTRRIEVIRQYGASADNYMVEDAPDGYLKFVIKEGDRVLASGKKNFKDREKLNDVIDRLVHFFSHEMPAGSGHPEDEDILSGDPYSFRVSVFIPNWPKRFRDTSFKHLLEKTLFLEIPSHVISEVYWLDHNQMREFEESYKVWIEEFAVAEIPDTEKVNNLIAVIKTFKA